jgi:hypothetical protein
MAQIVGGFASFGFLHDEVNSGLLQGLVPKSCIHTTFDLSLAFYSSDEACN